MTFSVARSPQTIRREERGVLASKSLEFGRTAVLPAARADRTTDVRPRPFRRNEGNNLSILHRRDRFLMDREKVNTERDQHITKLSPSGHRRPQSVRDLVVEWADPRCTPTIGVVYSSSRPQGRIRPASYTSRSQHRWTASSTAVLRDGDRGTPRSPGSWQVDGPLPVRFGEGETIELRTSPGSCSSIESGSDRWPYRKRERELQSYECNPYRSDRPADRIPR